MYYARSIPYYIPTTDLPLLPPTTYHTYHNKLHYNQSRQQSTSLNLHVAHDTNTSSALLFHRVKVYLLHPLFHEKNL